MARAEAVEVRALAVPPLLLEVDTDILQLEFNLGIVGGQRGQAAQGGDSILVTALLDQETRRLENEESTSTEHATMTPEHEPQATRSYQR